MLSAVLPTPARILDLPCGFGRHSIWLAKMGHAVTAVDVDAERVAATQRSADVLLDVPLVQCMVRDAEKSLALLPNFFDLAIVVHYYNPSLFEVVSRVLKPGGYLIFETFGAQGCNWQALPKTGLVPELLRRKFITLKIRERSCGPKLVNAVVQVFARRKEI